MSVLSSKGGTDFYVTDIELMRYIENTILNTKIEPKKILLIPPDFTRIISQAGKITRFIYNLMKDKAEIHIMPALGTHAPMTEKEIRHMYGNEIPLKCFKTHNWRNDVVKMGVIPKEKISKWSEGNLEYDVNIEVNKILFDGYDLILSIGQVLPHEVAGMANYTKNIMVGVGGVDTINKSHFLGAVCNMEKILGKADNPVRKLFNYGAKFLKDLPIFYILTCVDQDPETYENIIRGFFAGDEDSIFQKAASLSQKINIKVAKEPMEKIVVYLDPDEFKSTWLGNKAIYRTRLILADQGELLILAPGLKEFGEDSEIDRLIRKYGYVGTKKILKLVKEEKDLQNNLSAAAHLIHGSSEKRFTVTYAPGYLTKKEVESVNFKYMDCEKALARYNPKTLKRGWNTMPDGERIFYINNPGAGLWAERKKIF